MKRCLNRIFDPCLMSFLINSWIKSLFVIFIIHENGRRSGCSLSVCLLQRREQAWFREHIFLAWKRPETDLISKKKRRVSLQKEKHLLWVKQVMQGMKKRVESVCLPFTLLPRETEHNSQQASKASATKRDIHTTIDTEERDGLESQRDQKYCRGRKKKKYWRQLTRDREERLTKEETDRERKRESKKRGATLLLHQDIHTVYILSYNLIPFFIPDWPETGTGHLSAVAAEEHLHQCHLCKSFSESRYERVEKNNRKNRGKKKTRRGVIREGEKKTEDPRKRRRRMAWSTCLMSPNHD